MIKNIIFDFGGILIHIDYRKTEQAFQKLLGNEFTFEQLSAEQKLFFDAYEMGKINTETFLWNIQNHFGKHLNPRDIIDAWNSMLIGIPKASLDFLLEVRQQYKVYLMSNTNELHLAWVTAHLKEEHAVEDFDSRYFDQTYYSHLMGLKKPSKEIFKRILDEHKLVATETIFIDDLPENLVPPRELGLLTYNHPRNEDLSLVLNELLRHNKY